MKKTPLSASHEKLGARMIDFSGWYLPVQYAGIVEEHQAVRTRAGLFDLSHMGEFWLSGKDAMRNIQKVVTQDIEAISDRQIAYTPMCRPDGTIVDDLLVYRWNPEKFLLVVNAANIRKDHDWIASQLSGDFTFDDRSDTTALIAIQGPAAQEILQQLTRQNLKAVKYYWFTAGTVRGVSCIISRTGYTGEDGFELYFPHEHAEGLWKALLEAGRGVGLAPVGLGARDTLRLEARLMLYGNDIHDATTPIEANLDWTVKFGKGAFNGSERLRQQKEGGTDKTLVGFEMGRGPAPRHGYAIFSGGRKVGEVTSGTMSPTLQKNVGLGYVPPALEKEGSTFEVEIRGKMYPATVIPTPFYTRRKPEK